MTPQDFVHCNAELMAGCCSTYCANMSCPVFHWVVTLWINLCLGRFNISCFTVRARWAVLDLWVWKDDNFPNLPNFPKEMEHPVDWQCFLGCEVHSMSKAAYIWSQSFCFIDCFPNICCVICVDWYGCIGFLCQVHACVAFTLGMSTYSVLHGRSNSPWPVQSSVFCCHRGWEL